MSIAVQTSEIHHASPQALRDAWHALTAQQSLRTRDAAQKLGVSEAQLLATGIGKHVTRLTDNLRDLISRFTPSLCNYATLETLANPGR